MTRTLTFDNMIPAMADYATVKNTLDADLDAMVVNGDVSDEAFMIWNTIRAANDGRIREAYYLDTSDRNSRSTLDMTSAESLIELTKKILQSRK